MAFVQPPSDYPPDPPADSMHPGGQFAIQATRFQGPGFA
jgi:hypothetical protein